MSDSLSIEIYVTKRPGETPSVSNDGIYANTLDGALAEARAFIAHIEAWQAQIATYGLGEKPPTVNEPRGNIGTLVAETFSRVMKDVHNSPYERGAWFETRR